jgi:hypothetical protein
MTNLNQTIETPKLRIKETIKQEKVIEMEVSLPYFFKHPTGYCFYKIISKDEAIAVNNYGTQNISFEIRETVNHFLDNSIEIDEAEFEDAKAIVFDKIKKYAL